MADLHTIGSQLKRGWIVTRDIAEPVCEKVMPISNQKKEEHIMLFQLLGFERS